jgi:3-hydroxyisobutyrate dehydrogenase
VLYELVTASTGDSRVLRTRFPLAGVDDAHPASKGFAPLFALDLIAKDLELALELAAGHGVDAAVARAALDAYREAQRTGSGSLDYSAVFLRFASAMGAE